MRDRKSYKLILPTTVVALAALAMVLGFAGVSGAAQNGLSRKIVMFEKSFADVQAQKGLLRAFGAEGRILPLGIINGLAVKLPDKAVEALAKSGKVLLIEDDIEVHATKKPPWAGGGGSDDPPQSSQSVPWGVDRIDAEFAWPQTRGNGVNVAVLDSGIDKRHPDLAVAGGINFISYSTVKGPSPQKWHDDFGHGTHVAGIIAALDNSEGVVGVAPEVSLYAVKVLDRIGRGFSSDIILGIEWALTNGMHLVNMSLGSNYYNHALNTACNNARAAGLILVAAAGNDGFAVDYPAAYSSVIAVAATDSSDNVAHFSSYGDQVDVAAPGVDILSTYPGGDYATDYGTSMAAPHVTGALALRIANDLLAGGMKSFDFYRDALHTTADDLGIEGFDVRSGSGLVDAEQLATGNQYGNGLP